MMGAGMRWSTLRSVLSALYATTRMPIFGDFTIVVSADGRRKFKMRPCERSASATCNRTHNPSRFHANILSEPRWMKSDCPTDRLLTTIQRMARLRDVPTVCKMIGGWTLMKRVWQQVGED